MRNLIFAFIALVLLNACSTENSPSKEVAIIPVPAILEQGDGSLEINMNTTISCNDPSLEELKNYLTEGINVSGKWTLKDDESGDIKLIIDDAIEGNEAYKLTISKDGVLISASTENGVFYGIQTLLQLIPEGEMDSFNLPYVIIEDEPRFSYRGMHLDVGRHLFPVEFIKKYIDMLSMYKMNTFHWHLTEDQGWRIQIKKYPELTEISSFRTDFEGNKYGGFYTQEEVKEIVAYAAERYITVIPEIEMPGHTVAVLAAYPELACTDGPFEVLNQWGVHEDVFCAGNDQVFVFLEDVLTEVMELFPSKYIHIGGDECPKTRWEDCKKCQKRIKAHDLEDEHGLQSWFIKRIENFLLENDRRLIGWDEILEGGLAPEATVMSWRGIAGGIQAAQEGHDVIMTPTSHCYFDYYQGNPLFEPKAIGGYLTTEKVYSYEPIPEELSEAEAKHVLGAQGNVWTEYIPNYEKVEYMMMPRMMALSEVVWSNPERKNYDDFMKRFEAHRPTLDRLNINYSKSVYQVSINAENKDNSILISLEGQLAGEIRYTLDGAEPNAESLKYEEPFSVTKSGMIKAAMFKNGKVQGVVTELEVYVHKAFSKPIEIKQEHKNPKDGDFSYRLVDGLVGSTYYRDGYYLGFYGDDADIVIDLQELVEINKISLTALQRQLSWIFRPEEVKIYVSEKDKNYKKVAEIQAPIQLKKQGRMKVEYVQKFDDLSARFVKVEVKNIKKCPDWHKGAGKDAWIFLDEIIIE